jgi:hypothetical protein
MLIKDKYESYKKEVNDRFDQLKLNEEELNRIFIDIYGLNDELTPEVAEKDVTVARIYDSKGEVPESMKGNGYVLTKQDVIKNLISYIVGCIFGRYSLDEEGLIYAGGAWNNGKYKTFIPDADNILPVTDEDYFVDDIIARIVEFISIVYGEVPLEQNLQFIAKSLDVQGETSREIIRSYMLKDFFKDHCRKYKNRPIYWLFDSGKQNGFKSLVYLHRYNANTIGTMRTDYLHQVQKVYENQINQMQYIIDGNQNTREVLLATKKKEKYIKQLQETKEYDEVMGHVALQRIGLDLDDGVLVNYEKFQNIDVDKNKKISKDLLAKIK